MYATMDIMFAEWLSSELEKRGWSQADLAKRANTSRSSINGLMTGSRNLGPELANAIADAFSVSPITIFRKAGIIPPGPENEVKFEDWQYLLEQIPEAEREELFEIGQRKVERRKLAEEQARAANRKLKPAVK